MTRSAKHRPWPWLTVLAVAVSPAAAAEEIPYTADLLEHEMADVELIEAIEEAETVTLLNELMASGGDLREVELDDWFWDENPEFEATVQYLEEDGRPFDTEVYDGEFEPAWEVVELPEVEELVPLWEVVEAYTLPVAELLTYLLSYTIDSDGDGWSNGTELLDKGTDLFDKDTDDDGWADGPINYRYKLRLLTMSRTDTHPWYKCGWCDGDDDIYFVVDDERFPQASATYGNSAINGEWTLPDDSTITLNTVVEERIAPLNGSPIMRSRVSIWDDDVDLGYHDDWYEDDHYFSFWIDLRKAKPGQTVKVSLSNSCADFVVTFRVERTAFADPKPLDYGVGDSDLDGLSDGDEAYLAKAYEGMGDPYVEDIWVEVDKAGDVSWWDDQARTMVVSQFARHDINLRIDDGRFGGGTTISHTGTMSTAQWDSAYNNNFTSSRKGLFRYAILVDDLWSGRSGIANGDRFLVDADRYWFNVWTLTQAGTFMHELGHTLGLTRARFPGSYIDTKTANFDTHYYYSCMNYWYQYRLVDYSEGDDPGNGDLDDWGNLDLTYGLPGWLTVITP